MKKLKLIAFVFLLIMVSCSHSIDDVKVGMTTSEVKELLGQPNDTKSNSFSYTSTDGESVSNSSENWKYDNQEGTIYFENDKVIEIKK